MKSKKTDVFKYCPLCAARLTLRKKGHPMCPQCGFIFYRNSKPTASAIVINKKRQVLLVKRGIAPKKGYWDLPGGFLEDGEDPVTGLKRELLEELGVRIKPGILIGVYMDSYYYQHAFKTLNLYYEAVILSGTIRPMDDVADYKWFDILKIPIARLAFKNGKHAVRDWIRMYR